MKTDVYTKNIMSVKTKIDEDAILSRQQFEEIIAELYNGRSSKPEWTKERVKETIRIIEEFDSRFDKKQQVSSTHYYYGKRYSVLEEGGQKCLVQKGKNSEGHKVKIVPVEEYYDVLDTVHRNTGHGGRDKMLHAMKSMCSVPTPAVIAFVKLCQKCQARKTAVKKGSVFASRACMDVFINRGLVKLIDMQSTPDGNNKWILNYQDCTSKFSFLRPLTSDDTAEVASELLKIFLEIGGPAILQIEKGREYTTDVIKQLASLWPICKILNGRPDPEPTNSNEEQLENVYEQLTAWMRDNSSSNWARGLYFVQFQKNCTYHPCVQQTPYKALFGCHPKTGIETKNASAFFSKITLEEDLDRASTQKSVSTIKNGKIKNSCVQKLQYATLDSNVIMKKTEATLPEHSVQIKAEPDDASEKQIIYDMHTEVEIKSEGEDTTTDDSMNEPAERVKSEHILRPKAYVIESTSSHKPILCGVCGETTLLTHSCDSCHKIMHDMCGITFFGSTKLLCPECHKITNHDKNKVESPEVTLSEHLPAVNLERKIKVIRHQPLKRFGFNTVKCRCKVIRNRCRGQHCLCRIKNQACTIDCHNPLDCHNTVKVDK